ncbi:DarT ssDNA thymidine ADP-ribosyltransferase family protein [Algoriphagus sp. C2-6-M1]|uniref:DarT ssDNA thymidine ADP-ribosyltransferase family protein n=1 Tax=Algoriphagus persicinus TaxID=3108754 RepID=UPI002B40956B|nr:DarT ssDNA thymidine ADP-ribosyltransferase family protein [Algoriphagus sp. C2-6-M1]
MIIDAKGRQINKKEFGELLGFNLEDLAEKDILDVYLNGLKEYGLIEVNNESIFLTEFGKEAVTSKLKYKYFYASAQLFENQNAEGEAIDFSFKDAFGIHNIPGSIRKPENFKAIENLDLYNKLQFQLFNNDIYKGEVVEISKNRDSQFSYRNVELQCKTTFLESAFQINFYKNDSSITTLDQLVGKALNNELRDGLIRKGRYHYILANNDIITAQNIRTYIDICDWKELAKCPKVDWGNKETFELFKEKANGGIWKILSENVPSSYIKVVISDFDEYWNWSVLTQRLDNSFIKNKIHSFNWDFEELSFKETEFVIDLLSIPTLKDFDWDWNYLSQHLPDEFIEKNILNFNWDFHIITTSKNKVFKNVFRKHSNNLGSVSAKLWNWKYISEEININFLYKNIEGLALKIVWPIVLNRFFNDEDILVKCLKDENFKSLIKAGLPGYYRVCDQKFLWTTEVIDFLNELSLINWETKSYIKGLDTNEWIEWNKKTFTKYHDKVTTQKGFANVSKLITDSSLIDDFPDFTWDWEGISTNKALIDNVDFAESAFSGEVFFTGELLWDEILLQSSFDISFWNRHLEAFHYTTNNEKHSLFWELLTQQEKPSFIFSNPHFPWDWSLVTDTTSIETIVKSLKDEDLIIKWDWEIATRKLDKETILENLEVLTHYVNWSFIINEVFAVENELRLDNQLSRVAACLSILEDEKRKEYWKELTAVYPFPQLFGYVNATYNLKEFEWDWDMISNHDHFSTDLRTLNRFKIYLNWSIFSGSKAIIQKFDFGNWDNFHNWFKSTDSYLFRFSDYWDWEILSQNDNLTYNRILLTKYRNEKWDWEHLSEFGGFLKKQKKDGDDYLRKFMKDFPKIKFAFLSKRTDIEFDSDFILSNKDKDWDWQVLSENNKAKISSDLLLELKCKNWNWQAISTRRDIKLSNGTILNLLDKCWDWQVLSQNVNLEFNPEFIEQTKSKSWNWRLVSRHKSFIPNIETLTIGKDFNLDWEYISQNSSLNPTGELLSKFEDKWDWQSITQNEEINFSNAGLLQRFVDKWDWRFIIKSGQLILDSQTLARFKKYLDWDLISANTNINFTQEIIQEFRPFWNWTTLRQNKRIEELLNDYVVNEIENSSTLSFLDKIEQQYSCWKGSIYHFTHIDNAVEIIKNRKIQSRNRATIQGDAAGNVVHRRGDAHNYARFYFRPQTPTQFYNEFLGKNTTDGYPGKNGWVSWYERARGLGFPKCPVPIFFRFSLKEVLFKYDDKCCISNGNMQTNATKFGSIDTMIDKFGFDDLFYTPEQYATKEDYNRYRNYAQQEFLVRDELLFNDLADFEIVCPSDSDRALFINLLGEGQKDIYSKILVDNSYYNQENPRIQIQEDESILHIYTDFNGDGYFVLNGSNISELEVVSGNLNSIDDKKIIFKSHITIENKLNQDINVRFIDESNRNWFVYSNKYSLK